MSHLVVVEATSLIQSGDLVRAEALLSALVETEGDNALVEVLDDMPSKDLLAVMREYDSSKQSLLNLLSRICLAKLMLLSTPMSMMGKAHQFMLQLFHLKWSKFSHFQIFQTTEKRVGYV